MKFLKNPFILPGVAVVMFVITLIVLSQTQASYSANVAAIVDQVKSANPLKSGYKMAFDLGQTNYFGIIPVGTIVAILLVGLTFVPQLKKYANLLLVAAATLALCSFGVYLSNLGSSNFLVKKMNAAGPYGFKVNGTWAYYVGIIAQLVAACSLLCYAVVNIEEKK